MPLFEDPEDILDQMELGVPVEHAHKVTRISDRKLAIITAVKEIAKAGDVILIAGKGHETYQDIKGVKYDFDDKLMLALAFES
jgi:UDP-N-acetylmuramoyl-L-alanyl-D-glutamate--2,6-diaminopimelate ligase